MSAGKVLVILPSSRFLKFNPSHACMVGYHLKELAVPVKILKENDYQVIFATPNGETPFIDPNSLCDVNEDERLFYEHLIEDNTQLLLPLSLDKMTEEFLGTVDGLLIPGGYATLVDFWKDATIKHILKHMHHHCKPTAAIGHGAIALAYDLKPDEPWAYADYQMTCTPEAVDRLREADLFAGEPLIRVNELLENMGGMVLFDEFPDKGFIVEDRELITGQDPSSSKPVALSLIGKLNRYQKCRSC